MKKAECTKPNTELMEELYRSYAQQHAGPVRIEDIAEDAITRQLWRQDRDSAKRELKRKLTQWAKSQKYRDAQGRQVRLFHAAKYPKCVDKNGQMIFETMWDEHLKMTAIHAMLSFEQRARQIEGAHRSLVNDAESFNDNNPNGALHPIQLEFDWERSSAVESPQRVERLQSDDPPSPGPGLPR